MIRKNIILRYCVHCLSSFINDIGGLISNILSKKSNWLICCSQIYILMKKIRNSHFASIRVSRAQIACVFFFFYMNTQHIFLRSWWHPLRGRFVLLRQEKITLFWMKNIYIFLRDKYLNSTYHDLCSSFRFLSVAI